MRTAPWFLTAQCVESPKSGGVSERGLNPYPPEVAEVVGPPMPHVSRCQKALLKEGVNPFTTRVKDVFPLITPLL